MSKSKKRTLARAMLKQEPEKQEADRYENNILWDVSIRSMAGIVLQLPGLPSGEKAGWKKHTFQESGID